MFGVAVAQQCLTPRACFYIKRQQGCCSNPQVLFQQVRLREQAF